MRKFLVYALASVVIFFMGNVIGNRMLLHDITQLRKDNKYLEWKDDQLTAALNKSQETITKLENDLMNEKLGITKMRKTMDLQTATLAKQDVEVRECSQYIETINGHITVENGKLQVR